MWKRFKEPSTLAGIGIAALTALQTTGNWYYAIIALFGAAGAVIAPEGGKK